MSAVTSFSQLKLDKWILDRLSLLGITSPTRVQVNCIPAILNGKDCIGSDKTGSGKTLAFVLPILQLFSADPHGLFALVLSPTRELASQIVDQFKVIGQPIGLKTCLLLGGMNYAYQSCWFTQKPHIVVATPGRLKHILSHNIGYYNLNRLRFLVIDEADYLLSGRFHDELQAVISMLPSERQTLLFSATLTDQLVALQQAAHNKPHVYDAEKEVLTVDELQQHYVLCNSKIKDAHVIQIVTKFLQKDGCGLIIIFVNECRSCLVLSLMLKKLGLNCVGLHSRNPQKLRFASLHLFKSSVSRVLVATDVASRGLDIPDVDLVINYDIPSTPKVYIHRVGRTARAGRTGMAITFISLKEISLLYAIEDEIKVKLSEYKVYEDDALDDLTHLAILRRKCEMIKFVEESEEKRRLYKRLKMIEEGKNPDILLKKRDKLKEERRKRKKLTRFHKQHSSKLLS